MTSQTERKVVAQAMDVLVGKKVVRVRYMSSAEAAEQLWAHRAVVLEFDDGTIAYTACDEEANDAGVLFVQANRRGLCLGRFPS